MKLIGLADLSYNDWKELEKLFKNHPEMQEIIRSLSRCNSLEVRRHQQLFHSSTIDFMNGIIRSSNLRWATKLCICSDPETSHLKVHEQIIHLYEVTSLPSPRPA